MSDPIDLEKLAASQDITKIKTVWVVMGNDYPEAVFDNEKYADNFVKEKREENKTLNKHIHWRAYEFDIRRPSDGKY